jgi:hypothetical protein
MIFPATGRHTCKNGFSEKGRVMGCMSQHSIAKTAFLFVFLSVLEHARKHVKFCDKSILKKYIIL